MNTEAVRDASRGGFILFCTASMVRRFSEKALRNNVTFSGG
ncbi:hypothetical protein [Sinorhizobium meliloti]|nr:hypothetical protein [Sinorhizobium meliloti]